MMEHRALQFRFGDAGDTGTFSGHAAIFGEVNQHREIVQRGAFQRSLAEHQANGSWPLMRYEHRPGDEVGAWDAIREDDRGLFVAGRFLLETRSGAEAHTRVKRRAINGLSIGFNIRGSTRRPDGVRVLTDIDLQEISIVGLPSARGARITDIRSQPDRLASFAQACRQARCALITHKDKA